MPQFLYRIADLQDGSDRKVVSSIVSYSYHKIRTIEKLLLLLGNATDRHV